MNTTCFAAVPAGSVEPDAADCPATPRCIGLVEDDDLIRRAWRETLQAHGYRVLEAANGAQMLAQLADCRRPALIVLDMLLPGVDGFEFLARFYDRRAGERRRGGEGPRRERRRTDRRRRRPTGLVYEGHGDMIFDAPSTPAPSSAKSRGPATPGQATAPCTQCGQSLEFELPRFPQPPSRLEIDVVHSMAARGNAQHQVEISAFSGSGRPLLIHRIEAIAKR